MARRSTEPTFKHHLTGLFGSLLWFFGGRLPGRLRWIVGGACGVALYYLHRSRRSIVERNIELCFPEKTKEDIDNISRQAFLFAGRGVFSWGFALFSSDKAIARQIDWHGKETLVNFLKTDKPLILLCPHFVSPMLTLRAVGLLSPVVSMYEPPVNPIFNLGYKCALNGQKTTIPWLNWIYRKRSANSINMYSSRGSMLPFFRALKQNVPFFFLPDQNAGRKGHHVFAPFFGVPAATYTSLTRFSQYNGARIFLCFSIMQFKARGYEIHITQLPKDFISGDPQTDAHKLNETIEKLVQQSPEQYFWLHRRFKTRPHGESSIYGS